MDEGKAPPATTQCSKHVPPPPCPGSPQAQEDLALPQCGLMPALPRLLCYGWGHPQPCSLQTGTEQSPGQGQSVCWAHAHRVTPQERTLPSSPSTTLGKLSLSGSSHTRSSFRQAALCHWPWGGGNAYLWCLGSAVTVIKAGASSMASKYSVSSSSSLASPLAACTLPGRTKGSKCSGTAHHLSTGLSPEPPSCHWVPSPPLPPTPQPEDAVPAPRVLLLSPGTQGCPNMLGSTSRNATGLPEPGTGSLTPQPRLLLQHCPICQETEVGLRQNTRVTCSR